MDNSLNTKELMIQNRKKVLNDTLLCSDQETFVYEFVYNQACLINVVSLDPNFINSIEQIILTSPTSLVRGLRASVITNQVEVTNIERFSTPIEELYCCEVDELYNGERNNYFSLLYYENKTYDQLNTSKKVVKKVVERTTFAWSTEYEEFEVGKLSDPYKCNY
jgi:hypothetical protein